MTLQDFKSEILQRTNSDKYWNAGLFIIVILPGAVGFYFMITRPEKFNGMEVFLAFLFSGLIALGIFELSKLPTCINF